MLRVISKFLNSVKGARLWVQALDRAASGNFPVAREKLLAYSNFAPLSDPEFHLLMSFVEHSLGNQEEAFAELEIARQQILKSQSYSCDEKNYLLCYSDRLLNKMPQRFQFESGVDYLGDFSAIKLNRVSKNIQLNFPL